MDKEIEDAIGRALYEASGDFIDFADSRTPVWDDLLTKDIWIGKAKNVVETYLKCLSDKPHRILTHHDE